MRVLLFVSIILIACAPEKSSPRVPKSIAQIPLLKQIQGESALNFLYRLHGTSIPLQDGLVAFYGKGNEIILYLFEAETPEIAESLLVEMKIKMEEADGPFLPPQEIPREGFKISPIYATYGLGKGHFFFRKGNLLYWLTSLPTIAYDALRDLEEFILK